MLDVSLSVIISPSLANLSLYCPPPLELEEFRLPVGLTLRKEALWEVLSTLMSKFSDNKCC